MQPPPPPDVPAPAAPLPSGPETPPERFGSCSRVLFAPPEAGPGERVRAGDLEEIAYRRCPVGLISALDCPELVRIPCRHHDPRGDRPRTVVPRTEVAALAQELAETGYLTEAYRRRLRGLRVEVAPVRPLAGFVPPESPRADAGPAAPPPAVAAPRRCAPSALGRGSAPVNVPSDDARRRALAARRGGDGPVGRPTP